MINYDAQQIPRIELSTSQKNAKYINGTWQSVNSLRILENDQTVKYCYENKEKWDVIQVSTGFKNWMYLTVVFHLNTINWVK